ncbi:DUF1810 domain-containing protein [Ramlibacter sp. AW1]|uniref:DUF1810 domain-containing protein n=1 Tax=Ramlibacter aurantiacus TaxID=2801330 RepID=A0A936ZPI1_9BURK|nr:DUF1810 domain-containing protein [Ramlibacter aurantiacus]
MQLQRFVLAQDPVWDQVCAELAQGRKQGHWMWFVFPQLTALGRSATAKHYGLSGLDEARAYLAHPVLGPRLRQACERVLRHPQLTAEHIFGEVDAMKLRSCMTLFERAADEADSCFTRCLASHFGGERDPLTDRLLAGSE